MVLATFCCVATIVVLPLTHRGWLILLDWVPGPHIPLPRSFWGLDRGFLTSLPLNLAILGFQHVLGAATVAWLPAAAFFPLAGVGVAKLVGGSLPARIGGGLLYAVCPIVYERFWVGHFAYLLGYALLPYALGSFLSSRPRPLVSRAARSALWITALAALTLHFVWITGVVVVGVVIADRLKASAVGWAALTVAGAALASAYVWTATLGGPKPISVGASDVLSFQTRGDSHLGLFANVAGLYGFWRREPLLPKQVTPGWPFFLAAILLVVATGARAALRDPTRARLARALVVTGGLGFLLTLGGQGPTGPAFRWLVVHCPGFAVMREAQKFQVLLALTYAVLFGFGVDEIASRALGRWRQGVVIAVLLSLPVAYTSTLPWGLRGAVRPIRYPASWYMADQTMGKGSGKILFLPWHQYLSFPFTGHIVANPSPEFFRRDVIAGDNAELRRAPTSSNSPRSRFLEFLYSKGPEVTTFGQLVAPLGVEYVLMAKTADWQGYSWLGQQVDMEVVLNRPELTVYHNRRWVGSGQRVTHRLEVADWGEYVGASEAADLADIAVVTRYARPGSLRTPRLPNLSTFPGTGRATVVRRSPIRYDILDGPSGWVTLDEPYDPSWRLGDRHAEPLANGATLLPIRTGGATTARFSHWRDVRLGYALSVLSTAVLAMIGLGRIGPWRRTIPAVA